ncbi:general transcription factor II-I repeat domain-containing protein 1 isoform 1-T1 [Synchiropus picturatus]
MQFKRAMAQIRKLACDGVRTNSRGEPPASARQEILTSLVSALDSVCMAMSKLNAEVACVTVHEDSVIAVGTEKGRVFLNSRREIQTDFYKFCRSTCLQNVNSSNSQAKDNEVERSKPSKDGEHAKHRTTSEAQSNIFVLRKMVDEVFTVLYSEAVGKSSLVPVPYDWIQKEPGCLVAHGLPEGVVLKKPSEYDTKTLMKILEQSHRIQFSVKRPAEESSRESKSSSDLSHGAAVMPHVAQKTPAHVVTPSSTPSSSNSVLSNFLYGMPMSSKPHPDGKLDFKPASILNLGKDRLSSTWADKSSKDLNNEEVPRPAGDQNQSPTSVHISKRLLFSIVHEKSEKWDSFIRETEDINTLRECVQILFNSRYAEALGLDHMVPVPYRKIACDPGAVEIIGIPDQIPFKRPCTYGVPKLKRILDERHGIRFIVKRMFDERIFTAAGKLAREEGKYEPGCSPEEGFPDGLIIPPSTTELLSNSHSSRSASACVSPLADSEAVVKQSRTLSELLHPSAPPGDSVQIKKIKTEPPDGEVGQAAPEVGADEAAEPPSDPPTSAAPTTTSPAAPPAHLAPAAESHSGVSAAAEPLSPPSAQSVRRSSEGGSLVDDIGEMILQLRRQVESLFSAKFAEALGLSEPAKVPYSKFQMYPEELFVTGLPDGISLRRPNCFGAAKLRKILAASGQIQFVIKTPKLLSEQKPDTPTELFCKDVEVKEEAPEDPATASKRPGFSECLESKLTRIDLANTLREQVQDLFNRKYGEALGIKYPVQVPYKRIKNNPDSVIIQGLPPGIPFRKPCTFGSQNLERILAVADKIHFTITRPFQGLIPKPAPRRVTLLKKSFGAASEEEDLSCLGEKVVLREQVKELFSKKYGESSPGSPERAGSLTASWCWAGEALGLDRSVAVPYKLIRSSPESLEVSGLPDDVVFRNPNTYDVACLKKILQAADGVAFSVKTPLQPFAEICSQTCNTATEVSINRRKRKRVQESQRAPASADLALSTNQIPVMQWPMYMVDYSGVNMQVPGQVHY